MFELQVHLLRISIRKEEKVVMFAFQQCVAPRFTQFMLEFISYTGTYSVVSYHRMLMHILSIVTAKIIMKDKRPKLHHFFARGFCQDV